MKSFDQRTSVCTAAGERSTSTARPRGPMKTACRARSTAANQSGKKATRSVRREALITVLRGLIPPPEEPVAEGLAEEELEQEEVEKDEDGVEQEHGPGHRTEDLE